MENAPKVTAKSWLNVIFLMVFTALITCNMLVYAACTETSIEVFGVGVEQMTLLASVTSLVGVFTGLAFGRMLDTKDVKKCITLFLGLGVVIFFVRAFVYVFAVTLVCQFLGAFCVGICQVGAPKVVSSWFPAEKVGQATQTLLAGAGIGPIFIFALGAKVGIKVMLLAIAICFLALLIFWIAVCGIGPFKPEEAGKMPKEEVAKVYKSPTLWKLILTYSASITAFTIINSYLISAYLSKGLDGAVAGLMATTLNVAMLIGGYLIPVFLGKLKAYKPIVLVAEIGSIVCALLSWFLPIGAVTWVLMFLTGLFFGGSTQMQVSRIAMVPTTGEFSLKLIASANGFAETIKGIIAFFLPMLITLICGTNFNMIFIAFAILCLFIIIVGAIFIPELGEKAASERKAKGIY